MTKGPSMGPQASTRASRSGLLQVGHFGASIAAKAII
jgi:hypothetical protein